MRAVLQRVKEARVNVNQQCVGRIGKGLLIFLGVAEEDTQTQAQTLAKKISQLRIFEDDQGKMNLSVLDKNAGILVVSQFTLYGDCSKGRRPSFDKAADPKSAEVLYEYFVQRLRDEKVDVQTGQFRAMMDVALINDGPVTFVIDSDK